FVPYFNKNFTGYFQLKGYVNTTDNIVNNSTDFPVYRYAEVLLTYAEALAELGKITQSDVDMSVNLLRNRVGMPGLDLASANTNPDPLLMAKYPDVSGAYEGVILEIRRERRVEFAMEGYRYDDMIRWQAGKLLEKIPEGMYFPALGKYDMTGDGVPDIILIDKDSSIPSEDQKEKNSLGKTLVYYKAGNFGDPVTIYLSNGTSGAMVTEVTPRSFVEPKDYYRPIPYTQTVLNSNLKQIFGWD
ncbi:MAG: RagB/SusD family nutrient uptake outer membrane protein, partial [Ferruginibacter sp.]